MSAEHLGCPRCRISRDISVSVREWAFCVLCKYGGLWGEFMFCLCEGYECRPSKGRRRKLLAPAGLGCGCASSTPACRASR